MAQPLELDVGAIAGDLSVVTGSDRDELEIEISPVGADDRRTYNFVHERHVGPRVIHAALFPRIPVGEYVVWHNESTPAGTVVVRAGEVIEYHLT